MVVAEMPSFCRIEVLDTGVPGQISVLRNSCSKERMDAHLSQRKACWECMGVRRGQQ